MTRRIRVTLDLRTELDPGPTGEYIRELVGNSGAPELLSLHAREIRVGRAPVSAEKIKAVLDLRETGKPYEKIAFETALSRSTVIRICNGVVK